jgi:hypothetical protein
MRTRFPVTAFTSALCVRPRFWVVIACIVLALGTTAQAESPVPTATAAPSHARTEKLRTSAFRSSVSHLPIIDIVPIYTQPGFITTSSQTKGYDPFDVGGTITLPIAQGLSFSFDRLVGSIFDQASERILIDGVPTFPGLTRDSILVERLDYQLGGLTFEGGSSFRHRIDGASGVSTAAFPFTVENPKQNIYYETTEQVGAIVPVDPRHGLILTARDTWGAINFYENAPFPFRYSNSLTVGLTKKFNPFFSMTLRAQNSDYIAQGFPFPAPNAIHTETIDALADFHVDLNTLVHAHHL